mgnify:CR=1 FL=1
MTSNKNISEEQKKEWKEKPKYWKGANSIYYNPEDKRLLPPKKHPNMGWTINFGNPYSVLLLISFLTVIIYLATLLPG